MKRPAAKAELPVSFEQFHDGATWNYQNIFDATKSWARTSGGCEIAMSSNHRPKEIMSLKEVVNTAAQKERRKDNALACDNISVAF